MNQMNEEKPTALGVHIFAGGFTLGIEQAGFNVLGQLEASEYGVATTRKNHPGLPVFVGVQNWPLPVYAGKVKFVYGNPPCAPFSVANASPKRDGATQWRRDPRTENVRTMFHVLEVVRPDIWAWESVQVAWKRGRELIDDLTERAKVMGYSATYVFQNNLHLGVPQHRRRMFIVFHKVQIPWFYPGVGKTTVREAWAPLLSGKVVDRSPVPPTPTKSPEHLRLLASLKPGGSLRKAWEDAHPVEERRLNKNGGVIGRPRFLDTRLEWDEPAPVLTGGATKFHPEKDRYVTLLEQQLLCGYPPEYEFVGKTLADRYAQTAQAVMPPVGRWLGINAFMALMDPTEIQTPNRWIADLEHGKIEVLSE